ncbi:hypothetical protein Tco_0404575 [Tanacetum coccineum]
MYYPRFTKAIIHHFLTKDKSISMRNKMFMHTAQDDSILGNSRFVSRDEDTQVYGALIPEVMTTLEIRESPAYQTYFAFATREATPNPKRIYKKTSSPIIKTRTTSPKETPSKKKTAPVVKYVSSKKPSRKKPTGVQIRDTPGVSVSKKKAPINTKKSKGIELLSEAALLEDAQMKKALKKSKRETHSHQKSGSGDGGDSGEDDDSNDDDSDDGNDDYSDNDNDDERTESDSDHNDDDKEEEYEEEYVHTPKNYELTNDEDKHHGEEGKEDIEITNAGKDDVTQEKSYEQVKDDAHVTLTQKIEDPLQSSSVSSDFGAQFLNLDNIPLADNEVVSMMNVKVHHEEPSNQKPSILTIPVTLIPKTLTATATTVPLPIPLSAKAEESMFEVAENEMPQNQGSDLGNTDDQPDVEAALKHDWFKKPKRPLTPDLDWNARKSIDNLTQELLVGPAFNLLKGTCRSRVELDKPLPLVEDRGRQVVPVDYFINNDLEYLKGGSSSRKYTTSTTKTKAAKYDDIQGIEDMVPSNMVSKHDVYSTKRIIVVTNVKVMKWYEYGYLEEIEVRKEDQKLYKFKEGDFPRLNLHDIEDMSLLLVQKSISNQERDVIFDLGLALQMFTKRVVILKRVEDLQLGVESCQKKLNITKPETFKSNISNRTPYTAYNNPQRIIYLDKYKRNRLMRTDELYKFSDGTLTSVRTVLHDIASNLRMDYLPKRRWSKLDKKRSRIMIKAIDQQLFERRLMRNLEKFVGGRDCGEDIRLLQRTI